MWVDWFEVEAFRGIPAPRPVRLDPVAGLTVLYAPNGTGKSSVVDAAEWWLTGTVDRLAGVPGLPQAALANRFSGGAEPRVRGSLRTDGPAGEPWLLEASRTDRWREGEGRRRLAPGELLARLTGRQTFPSAGRGRPVEHRRAWVKGTRFLSAETLGRLVADDADAKRVREEVFARILGLGELQDAIRKLDTFLAEVGSGERYRQEGARKEREAQGVEQATAAVAYGRKDVETRLESVEALLAESALDEPTGAGDDRLDELARRVARWESDLALDAQALGRVTAGWEELHTAETRPLEAEPEVQAPQERAARVGEALQQVMAERAAWQRRLAEARDRWPEEPAAALVADVTAALQRCESWRHLAEEVLGIPLQTDDWGQEVAQALHRRESSDHPFARLAGLAEPVSLALHGRWHRHCPLCDSEFLSHRALAAAIEGAPGRLRVSEGDRGVETLRRVWDALNAEAKAMVGTLQSRTMDLHPNVKLADLYQRQRVGPHGLSLDLRSLLGLLRAGSEERAGVEARAAEALSRIQDQITRLQGDAQATQQDLVRSVSRTVDRRVTASRLHKDWERLAPGQDPTPAARERVEARLADGHRRVEEARARLSDVHHRLAAGEQTTVLRTRIDQDRSAAARLHGAAAVLDDARQRAQALREALARSREEMVRRELEPLVQVINDLYLRAQANEFVDAVRAEVTAQRLVSWTVSAGGQELGADAHLSLGQRHDLALAIFLARARALGGTFFLDEPLAHLDDLNRVAVFDALRLLVAEPGSRVRLVLTTASARLVRHLREKFQRVPYAAAGHPPLRLYWLSGGATEGVRVEGPEDVGSR